MMQMPTMTTPPSAVRDREQSGSQNAPVKVAYVVGGLYTEASGIGRITCDLSNALSRHGVSAPVYTVATADEPPAVQLLDDPARCIAAKRIGPERIAFSPQLKRRLSDDFASFDVVHHHSMWMLPNRYASAAARQYGLPTLFTAYGYLEPWAIERSRWKKRLAGWAFQDRDLNEAACIHVNTPHEIGGIRDYGLRNPVAVIPNGVSPEIFDQPMDSEGLRKRLGISADKRVALFLSRLHEKKGLAHLVEAWKELGDDDWHLLLVGQDDGAEAITREAVERLGISERVTFAGPLMGDEKLAALTLADLFVLPSHSEGFAAAILEALASRLPVIITPACNFPEVALQNAGVEVEPTVSSTLEGLRALTLLSDSQRQAMGRNGRDLVDAHYSWERIAGRMKALYQWLRDGDVENPPQECGVEFC